jgi:hypothetical protein
LAKEISRTINRWEKTLKTAKRDDINCITCEHGFINKGIYDCRLNKVNRPCDKWQEDGKSNIAKKRSQVKTLEDLKKTYGKAF